jgi:hypothetical protein
MDRLMLERPGKGNSPLTLSKAHAKTGHGNFTWLINDMEKSLVSRFLVIYDFS